MAGRSKNRPSAARSILRQFRAAVKALLDDEPPPPAPKKRSGDTRGALRMAVRAIMRRVPGLGVPVRRARDAFGAAARIVARRTHWFDWLPAGYDGRAVAEPLDAANPYWDCSLDDTGSADPCAGTPGPSLDS